MATARLLATTCREFEELLARPISRSALEDADETLPSAFRDLAQKDSAWEGLDEAEIATSAPLLLGPKGLLELSESGGQDNSVACVIARRHAVEACARFLDLYGSNRAVSAVLMRRARHVAEACLGIFRNDVDNKVGLNALLCMLNALEIPKLPLPATSLGDDLLRELKLRHSKLTAGQSSMLHQVLAVLADARAAQGAAVSGEGPLGLVSELRTRLLGTLQRETNLNKPTLELVAGLLEACSVLLRRHAQDFSEEELLKLYNIATSVALTETAAATRLGPRKAALRLFQDHALVFRRLFAREAQALPEVEARKPGDKSLAESPLLNKMLASTTASQADLAAAGRGMLDAVLWALSDGVLIELDAPEGSKGPRKRPLDENVEVEAPAEAAVVRGWYPRFHDMVLGQDGTDRLTGARSLGALVPAVARLEGAAVVLDFLEVMLEAAEAAATPQLEEEDQPQAEDGSGQQLTTPVRRLTPSALPELAEALSRTIPSVSRWLTGTQWVRLLAVGVQLIKGFGRAFTKKRPFVARAVAKLLSAFRGAALEREREDNSASIEPYEALVAQGIASMVTEDESLQALWELVLTHLEQEKNMEELQLLTDSLTRTILTLARQGVENYLRLQQQEEKGQRKMADYVSQARARGSLTIGAATVAMTMGSQDVHQAIAEVDPVFAVNAVYVYEQASQTSQFLRKLSSFLDRAFGSAALPERRRLLATWVPMMMDVVVQLVSFCRSAGAGPPPPGVFRLLRVALSAGESAGQLQGPEAVNPLHLPLGFLEEIASGIDGFEGVVAMEAMEALLAVPPALVRAQHWLPVFQRALGEGLQDPELARHVLSELERWRNAGAGLDWSLLLPNLASFLAPASATLRRTTAAERRATRGLATAGQKAEDRRTLVRRLLRFVGSLGGECHGLVLREPKPEELLRPISKLGLKLSISLGGTLVELEPSELLPHLARLLQRGPRRGVRLAAGESLHALLRHVIGNDSVNPVAEAEAEASTAFADVLRAPLLPLALRAASDEDATLAELFKSLLKQLVAWMAHRPPTASLSSLRDALLEAMGDPHSPALRYTAAQFFAELLVALQSKPSSAKRLLQYLISAAKHVDRRTQLAALRALRTSWCSFSWEHDAELPALEVMQVVILCLQTSHRDGPSGLPAQALALQLGGRLLESLLQALHSPRIGPSGSPLKRINVPDHLVLQLWRGSGLPECAARGFCRMALRRLQKSLQVTAASSTTATAQALNSKDSPVEWKSLALTGGADNAQQTLELLAVRLDTPLWLALPEGGQALLDKSIQVPYEDELALRAAEEASLLVPWSSKGILDPHALSTALRRFAPREREQVVLARTRALVSLVATCRLQRDAPSSRSAAVLITLLLDPVQLQLSNASWRSLEGRQRTLVSAAEALARGSLSSQLAEWHKQNPHMDLVASSGASDSFEVFFQGWPEHRDHNALGVAERMAAYVEGLEVLRDSLRLDSGGLWSLLFQKWVGGMEAFLKAWHRSMAWRTGRKQRSAASQTMVQALVRFLLVALPQLPTSEPSIQAQVISSLLCIPRPPAEAMSRLLHFFSDRASIVFEASRPWPAGRKRLLLSWLCDFISLLGAERDASDPSFEDQGEIENSEQKVEKGDGRRVDEGEFGPALQGSVLAALQGPVKDTGNLGQAFARLLRELPAWHEWAVSDAAHGGADDEDAPPEPQATKRRKSAGASMTRVRRARADRTGLYQLAVLLRNCCSVEPVLVMMQSAPQLCKFLSDVLQAVLGSQHAPPRTKGLFLEAIPPLVLKAEVLQKTAKVEDPESLSTAASAVEATVRDMVTNYFPLNSREYQRNADEYSTYLILLEGLFHALERSAPSMRLLGALHSTLRVEDHREALRLRDFVRRFVRHVLATQGGMATFKALLQLFLDPSLDDRLKDNIRFGIMEKLALPLLWDLVTSPMSCKDCWVTHWQLLLQYADPDISFANLRMRDVDALNLKVQEMACVYGMIEVLFIRTPAELLKEQIVPELGGSSPSRDIILIAKRALKKPTGWERVDLKVLRRCQLRIYGALSAAVCATQTRHEMYSGWLFEKVLWDETMVEPWESGYKPDMSKWTPDSNYNTFQRPGYSFAYLSAAIPGRRPRKSGVTAEVNEESTLLGAGLWAATPAFTQGTLARGVGTLGRAAAAKASQELTLMLPEKQRRKLATCASKAATTSQVMSLVVTGSSDGLSSGEGIPLPPGEEGAALRLQAVLAGRRLQAQPGDSNQSGTWQTEWLEHDEEFFPTGPSTDCALTLFLILLRTLDVLTERFGLTEPGTSKWLQSLLAIVEKASADFRLRILLLRVFIQRADALEPVLLGRNVEVFRFVISILLDPRFCAEKRFHYLARDAVSTLLVPKLGQDVVQAALPRDCLMDAERLLHQLQITAPHKMTFWQKAHLGILRLFASYYLRPGFAIHPDGRVLLRQLTAKNRENAIILQQSGLRQLVIFLEYGTGFDPVTSGSLDGSPAETAWKDALLNCVLSKDLQLSAYACGAVALLAKWQPTTGRGILAECCGLVESPPIQARLQDRTDGLRLALCAEQILLMCPWALSDAPDEAEAAAAMSDERGPPRRKLFARMLQRLPNANAKVLRALLSGLLELCRDCVQADESGVAPEPDALSGRRGRPPPRPSGDAVRSVRRARLEEVLLTLRAGEIWRRGLQCKDGPTQLVTARLICAVASRLDDEALLSCLGLMLEAEASLRENSSADTVEHRIAFEKELLSLCIGVCERRPDVARGEVAEGVLGFLVRWCVSEEWRGLKEVLLLKLGEVKAQEVQEMADQVKSSARDFWEAQLSGDAPQRVADLCLRLGGKTEHESSFISATLQLLLSLARKSADYRQIKNKPLSDIEFRPMQISASSWASTGLPQTFQLGSAWASQLRGSHSQTRTGNAVAGRSAAGDVAGSVAASLSAEALPRELRAARPRKELPPVPSFAAQAKAPGKETAASLPTGTGTGLLRHTDEDSRRVAIFRQERETKAALASLERREREGSGEEATVDLVSGYREGSYPDVEVSLADILEPLARAAAEDVGLAEELLLAMWSGMTGAVEVLSSAFNGLVTGCLGDVTLVHFLHSLVVRCSHEYAKMLPLPAFQRSVSSSQLSGIQALEELLPEGLGKGGILRPSGDGPTEEMGRYRAVLSALYGASSALGEEPSMSAVVAQLRSINAFSSPHSSTALCALRDGQAQLAQESLVKVLDQEEAAVPSWELQMASAARINALEELMSWKKLQQVLPTHGAGADLKEKTLRADLGLRLFEDSPDSRTALDIRLKEAAGLDTTVASPQSAALLAIYAISAKKWDDARRLVYQGYDSFTTSWNRLPLLAARARHEQLSALPLLQNIEIFLESLADLPLAGSANVTKTPLPQRPLSQLHDRFSVWIDTALSKVAISRWRQDSQAEAEAYSELGKRCCEGKNLTAAQEMMKRCLQKRKIPDYRFFDNVLELKLLQREKPCVELCSVAKKEILRQKEPEKSLPYTLILAKIAKVGYERQEMGHHDAWQALVSARGLAEQCSTSDSSKTHAKVAEFADAVLRREEDNNRLSTSNPEQVELVEALITGVLTALQLGDGDGLKEAFQQAHERLPRVFELLAFFKGCSHVFETGVAAVPSWPFLRWLPQALAHLPNVPALQRPLQALASDYPQALFWPLQLSSHQDIVGQRQAAFRPLWAALEKTKAPVKTAQTFTRALDRMTHPEKSFPAELRSFREAVLAQGGSQSALAKARWTQLWRKHVEVECQEIAGQVHVEFGQRVKIKMQDLGRKLGLVLAEHLRDVDLAPSKREAWIKFFQEMQQLPSTKQWPNRKAPIEAFSPWLGKFDARGSWLAAEEQLEVLGQYRGLHRPEPLAHARITRFGPQLLIMASKQMPKRLVVLGSDEREHWFLVKGGEDVRLDERVEQLFGIVNSLMAPDAAVGLRVRTYAVVPLLPDLGALEWVRDTKPLKAIVQEVAKAKDMGEIEAHKLRTEWSKRFGGQAVQRYSKIFELPKADAVVAFQRCVAAMPSTASLKAFFWNSAMGPEAFWHTRQRFAASLACASAACYLLGIGDRHLDNYLLCLRTAEIVPIDFGYSFGIGALLPVPELMPFRLTSFLLSALQPLSGPLGHGTFRDSLEEVLFTCRSRSGILLDVCALFIREPLLDWTTESRRRGFTDLEFLPKRRLHFLAQRLKGLHPASVLKDELMDNQTAWVKDMARRTSKPLEVMVAGLEDEERAKVYHRSGHLSPAEQADCLIRQATDPNILGRAWEGWAPEI